ncbi:uncharacterized protein B0H18DRAFT_1121781 [Fomitopsis serialis]|uniref:uncharacterized protein n=1 Tax=Fomitopsis serialis TaxID=139415 RepID=UPI002008B034|nr:uncharacterized protein B0H18DRAFT_1121781 [Neoantrodia serialis]KAH9920687.1 hypothetical protein B0H18DRAFT_1121781 [Neoantrodia serialis]
MSLAKLPFLCSGLAAGHILSSPPQPKVDVQKRPRHVGLYERFFSATAYAATKLVKITTSAPLLLEIAVILASKYPSHRLSQLVLRTLVDGPFALTERITLSRPVLVCWGLGMLGTYIRYQCYRALDRSFTLELAVRDEQQLVTGGPYSYVRHPSYTAAAVAATSISLMQIAQGSWAEECGILQTQVGRAIGMLHIGLCAFLNVSILLRTSREDAMLKKHFGKEWEEYAKRVPYRLIPFVY